MKKLSASMLAMLLCFCMVLSGCDAMNSRIQQRKDEREKIEKENTEDKKDEDSKKDKDDKKDSSETEEPKEDEKTSPSEEEPDESETTVTEATETTVKETEPEETEPAETTEKETEATESEPDETKTTETEPSTEPTETTIKETEPEETKATEKEPKETETKETEPKETEPKETTVKGTETKETEPEKVKFDRSVYNQVLSDMVYTIVDFDDVEFDDFPSDYSWISDEYWYSTPQDLLLENVYTYLDINDDGIDELFILSKEEEFDNGTKFFTVKDVYTVENDKPVLILSGWSRNLFIYQKGGSFFNSASNGAFSSSFGDFVFDKNLKQKTWKNFYFTDYNDDNEIYTYYNKTGKWEPTDSELVEDGAIWDVTESYINNAYKFKDVITLESFAVENDIKVKSKHADINVWEMDSEYAADDDYSTFVYGTKNNEFASYVQVCTNATIYDVEFLKFSDHEIDEDGNITFLIETIDTIDSINKMDSVVFVVEFPEYLPYYGFSYKDYDGSTAAFSLNMSGEDGSIYLSPITIE